MQNSTFIGLDVHKATISVPSLPWTNFAPPFSAVEEIEKCGPLLGRSFVATSPLRRGKRHFGFPRGGAGVTRKAGHFCLAGAAFIGAMFGPGYALSKRRSVTSRLVV